MQSDNKNSLLISLLALMVMLAPVQAAVSAVTMLAHDSGLPHQCHTEMVGQMDHKTVDHAAMEHGDCCQHDGAACPDNCPTCTQCASGQAALLELTFLPQATPDHFESLNTPPIKGIPGHSAYRPPQNFS